MVTESGRDPAFATSPSSPATRSRRSALQSGVGFTPGPWKISQSDDPSFARIDTDGERKSTWTGLASVVVRMECEHTGDFERDPEGEANARLIAAAPKLYEALREIAETNDAAITANVMCAAIMRTVARAALALAAATGTAKTPKAVECEASQSGAAKTAQRPTSSTQSGVR